MVQIVCRCRQLVEVRDKRVVDHEDSTGLCPNSGAQYVPTRSGCSSPEYRVKSVDSFKCKECGDRLDVVCIERADASQPVDVVQNHSQSVN